MDDSDLLARQFEEHRERLRAVGYRMLGSFSEADDAVQETWLRLSRADTCEIENLAGWLTTVVSRVCLNMLQSRARRGENSLDEQLPEPRIGPAEGVDPAEELLLAESVSLALMVILESLSPAERLAFVLHDMFLVPFQQIAPIVGRSDTAVRQLASRARRRVQAAVPPPDHNLARHRKVVDAFFAAARRGDFEALVAVLDPDIVLRTDQSPRPGISAIIRGAPNVAGRALMFAGPARRVRPVLVNGSIGVVVTVDDQPVSIMSFTVASSKIVAIDAFTDPKRLHRLELSDG